MKSSPLILILLLSFLSIDAQILSDDLWTQMNMVSIKASQLYCEASMGVNVRHQKHSADFMYFSYGFGKPTKRNAWRKFIPENEIPESLPKDLKDKIAGKGTEGLYGGLIGAGWNHWFNHAIGVYVQSGWGFVIDLSSDDLTEDERLMLAELGDKNTFIYNTVPVEMGLTLNLWKRYNIQAGVTYMWKEIPLLTLGLAYLF